MRAGVTMSATLRALALAGLFCSCANAGNGGVGGGGGDDAPKTDASVKTDGSVAHPDAPGTTDAPSLVDAPVVMVDAAVDAASGPFCAQNTDCTVAGQCCVTLGGAQGFCAPGSVILGQCFPQ